MITLWKSSGCKERVSDRPGSSVPTPVVKAHQKDDIPTGRTEGQVVTLKPVLVDDDFAGKESHPSAAISQHGHANQGTTGGRRQQVKRQPFQALVSEVYMSERFRVLDPREIDEVRSSSKTLSIRSAIERPRRNEGFRALSRETARPAKSGRSFSVVTHLFSDLDPVELHAPPLMFLDEHSAWANQQEFTYAATEQDKAEASIVRFASIYLSCRCGCQTLPTL